MEQEIVILNYRQMSGKHSRIRGTKGLDQTAWSLHLCHWLEMAEPGRMEVLADPSFPGLTAVRILQVPAPVPACSVAGILFPVGAHTHTEHTHAWSHRSTAVRERSWYQYPCRHQQHLHKRDECR